MIKIKLKNAAEIEKWYAEQVIPIIKKKIAKYSSGLGNEYVVDIVAHLDDNDALRDLLTMKINDLIEKHTWARDYYEVACFDSEVDDLHEYLNKHKDNSFIISVKEKHLNSSVSEVFDEVNKELSKIINYDFLNEKSSNGKNGNSSVRAEYVKRLGIRVCPYCNQQYVYHFGDSRYLGDLDHILPKSKFALFSMSMYNLIPVCKPCNQLFKRTSTEQILNPYEEGFDDDAYLSLNYKSVREMVGIDPVTDIKWRVNKLPKKGDGIQKYQKIENAIELFKLNEVYKEHVDEIQLALKQRNDYSRNYRKVVNSLVGISNMINPKLLYGVSFDEEKYQDELMSKAIDDVVWRN